MILLGTSLVAFVLVHAALSRAWLRDPLAARLGRSGYGAINGVVSLAALIAVFWAYRTAPYVELWPVPATAGLVPVVVMPIACLLAVAGLTTPCAGMRGDRLPEGGTPAPGILSITRHPLPAALVLWAAAHLAANGDAAAVLLFGTLLCFAAIAPRLVDRRRARLCGQESWSEFAAATSTWPFAAALAGRSVIDWRGIGWSRAVSGILLYVALLFLHPQFAGVAIAPGVLRGLLP